ncbi:hypothetical protein BDZ89DRAFT_404765 [Hymenopellis radicata]|nr:hypothetical protein BDZ89DRAFT_404765 [Hymenopellis radicata]
MVQASSQATMTDSTPPCLSFIGIVDFSQEARWLYMTDSVVDLLGFEANELYGHPSIELVHPDESMRVRKLHHDTIKGDKAAALVYLRMRHKDPYKGYVLCSVSRTIVHNVVVGSVSFASPGAKALHNASTAQEITVLAPVSESFQLRRWHDPSPLPPSPRMFDDDDEDNNSEITYNHLPSQSFRTALILDRFTLRCNILYCSNDLLIDSGDSLGRSFFDYVSRNSETNVRDWINLVKGWGVNETGQPSDGGFGFGKFALLKEARESEEPSPEPLPRIRNGGRNTRAKNNRRNSVLGPRPAKTVVRVTPPQESPDDSVVVDAIFSAHSDGIIVILRRASS